MHIQLLRNHSLFRNEYVKQLAGSLIFKMLMVLASFLLMPLMLKYLGDERYGIWLTMYSVVSWALFFDCGIGNGVRNKLSEYLEHNRYNEAIKSISSAYVSIAIISLLIYILVIIAGQFIDWNVIFNTEKISAREIQNSFLTIFGLFLVNFVLSIIDQLFHATKKTEKTVLRSFFSNLFSLITVYIANVFFDPSLTYLAIAYGSSLVLSSLLLTISFYSKFPNLIPSIKYFDRDRISEIINLGGQFFIIQIAVLVIFTTDKIIIAQVVSPAAVVPYEITIKLFSLVLVFNNLFLNPLWSAYTRAFARQDIYFIKSTLKKTHVIFVVLSMISLLIYLLSHTIIDIWMGGRVMVQESLVLIVCVFIIVRLWCDIYAYFLNGISKIKVQMYLAVIQATINLPISICLGRKFGVEGVLLGSLISLSLSALVLPLYSHFLIKNFTVRSCV
ncbi:lipopolysaccharide biosynthesis protein [Endozoicomonas acroporae]|uniref:oligosaccharide flippase family protein n=1 Tax=Endozoicomonas acroporae TaxID=1701104 RepID=UPI000C774ED0